MPFGAVGAVYAWDRVAEAVVEVLRRVFLVPAARYVDDIFFVDFEYTAVRTREIVMAVVDAFGLCLEPDKTPAPAMDMVVLGVRVSLTPGDGAPTGIDLRLDSDKRLVWLQQSCSGRQPLRLSAS